MSFLTSCKMITTKCLNSCSFQSVCTVYANIGNKLLQNDKFLIWLQEEGDNEYESENSDSEDTDSDISIDENDEVKSDVEDEDGKRKKKGVNTKAYKVVYQ